MNFLNRIAKKMYIQNVANLKYLKKTLLILMFIKTVRQNMEYFKDLYLTKILRNNQMIML